MRSYLVLDIRVEMTRVGRFSQGRVAVCPGFVYAHCRFASRGRQYVCNVAEHYVGVNVRGVLWTPQVLRL